MSIGVNSHYTKGGKMEKDDLGIEVDDDVAGVLKDPKGGLLLKTFDYLSKRKDRQRELDDLRKQEEIDREAKDKKLFGIF